MTNDHSSRRKFLRNVIIGAGVIPALKLFDPVPAVGQNVPNKALNPAEPMPTTLGYVADASKVDKAKFPKYAEGQHCKGCTLYLEGGKTVPEEPGEHGRCGLFMTGLVNANGWCNSYVAKIV